MQLTKGSPKFAGGDPVLANDDPVCISVDFDRTPDRARLHRVFVVIEPDKAGLGDRGWHRMEAVEPAGIGNKLQPLQSLGPHIAGRRRIAAHLGNRVSA
jgi:hypothetical protein